MYGLMHIFSRKIEICWNRNILQNWPLQIPDFETLEKDPKQLSNKMLPLICPKFYKEGPQALDLEYPSPWFRALGEHLKGMSNKILPHIMPLKEQVDSMFETMEKHLIRLSNKILCMICSESHHTEH